MRSFPFLVLGGAIAVSGCFSYVPVSPADVSPGQEIRLRLTAEEAARYPDLRLREPRLMEGRLVAANDGEMLVEASIGNADPTRGSRVFVQQVAVPRSGIVEIELREVDKMKTGLLVAGGGAVITAVLINAGGGFGRRENPPPDIVDVRPIPRFGLSLPLGGRR